jgi:hypothetical protein
MCCLNGGGFNDVQVIIETLLLLVPSINYAIVIVTKLFEREARNVLFQQKAISKE